MIWLFVPTVSAFYFSGFTAIVIPILTASTTCP
jgi:hypothetical protein